MNRSDVDSILILGRRWFDKINGNTYHSCKVYVNNNVVGTVNFEYGYDDSYRQTAWQLLIKLGLVSPREGSNDSYEPAYVYCDRKKIKLDYDVVDVQRKRDLAY